MKEGRTGTHTRLVLTGGAVLLALLAVMGIAGLLTRGTVVSAPDISTWRWETVDEGRISLLAPDTLSETAEPGGQPAWQTPDSVMPYIRLVWLGETSGDLTEETLKTQLGDLLAQITAAEQPLSDPYFIVDEEGTAYTQVLTAPERGLVSATRVFVARERVYCVYLTTAGDPADEKLAELIDTFFDSVSPQI